jgi:DNA topoisomerase-1
MGSGVIRKIFIFSLLNVLKYIGMSIPFQGHDAESVTESQSLIYVQPYAAGYRRQSRNGKFIYLDQQDKTIKDKKTLQRIASLVIPPAWQDVWICASARGHLQVTGIDARGRKQYRYHPKWQKVRNETKFDRLYYFGKRLGKLRRQIKKDLRRKSMDKVKISALAISIMEQTLIRVGNAGYEKEYGSHGLTTLKNSHVHFKQGYALFKFKGKKNVQQLSELKGKALVNLLKKVKALPGQELFQYYDDEQQLHSLNSSDINEYLHEQMGEAFTCKDFRSWAGCIAAIKCMLPKQEEGLSKTALQKALPEVIDAVARKLGNTRAVCRKYYIHPRLLQYFEEGKLQEALPGLCSGCKQEEVEKALLAFLKKQVRIRK